MKGPKSKINLRIRIKHLFLHHPWLKIISLIMAVLVWFLVKDQINRFNF